MRLANSGDLTEHSVAEIFQSIAEDKASGLLYLKNADGVNAFVVFMRGVSIHASGEIGEGEEAVKKVLTWSEGDYRFLEDVKPDPGKFPPNIAASSAASWAGGGPLPSSPTQKVLPPMPVLPCRGPSSSAFVGVLGELLSDIKGRGFTGTAIVYRGETRVGLFVFKVGELTGGMIWDGTRYVRGERALATFEAYGGTNPPRCELCEQASEVVTALAAGLSGRLAITRFPSPVVNIEEFMTWAQHVGFTGLVSILTAEVAANILFFEGRKLGAATSADPVVKENCDDALALYYSPGATVEVYRALPGT